MFRDYRQHSNEICQFSDARHDSRCCVINMKTCDGEVAATVSPRSQPEVFFFLRIMHLSISAALHATQQPVILVLRIANVFCARIRPIPL